MNDLDDDLFGSLIKPKNKPASSRSDKLQYDKKKTKFKDFDDDDPLAGLLPDDNDNVDQLPKAKLGRGSAGLQGRNADQTRHEKTDVLSSATSLLPDSPPARRRNILDDLMAKSDVARTAEKVEEPSKSGFVLGDHYRSSKPAQDEEVQFGSYVPSADPMPRSSGTRRPGTGASSSDDDVLGLLTDAAPVAKGPQERPLRRWGISPTIEPPKADAPDVSGVQSKAALPPQLPRSRSTDWLELKDDPPARATQAARSGEKPESGLRRRDREDGRPPTAPALTIHDTDWLGAEEKKQPAEPEEPAKEVPKTENFLDWLGSKTKVARKPEVKLREDTKPDSRRGSFTEKKVLPPEQLETRVSLPLPVQDVVWATSEKAEISASRLEYEGRLSSMRTQMADIHTKFSEESLAAAASLLDLQTKVRRLQFERDQLSNAFDGLELRHKEELAALETSFKKRTQLIEESYQRREQRLHEELDFVSQAQIEKQKAWESERSEIVTNWQRRVDEATQYRMEDLEKIKELHRSTVVDMKKDHEMAIARLQQIKKIEVDAMSEAQSHSKTLQSVIDQLKSNTIELSQLQFKVEDGHLAGVEERGLLLETKNKQLTMLQEQLKKQREDNEQERLNLRQLISRLEDNMHQQTLGLEEERWKIVQDRNRLDVEQKTAEESRKLAAEKLEKERALLQKSKVAFLEEQKMVMQQIYSENAKAYSSAGDQNFPIWTSQKLAQSSPLYDLQVQAEFESSLRAIESEKKRSEAKQRQLTSRLEELEKERRLLERHQEELEEEKSAMNALAVQVKQRSEEVEEMCLAAVQTREEGFAALQEASKAKAEIQRRQEDLKERFEELSTRERNLAEERLRLAQVRRELEHLRSRLLCVQCQNPVGSPGDFQSSRIPVFSAWQMEAEKDKEFLQRESLFLESLRSPLRADFRASMSS